MPEIFKPRNPVYWVARDVSGNVVREGRTDPGLVTTTGLTLINSHGTEDSQLDEMALFPTAFPAIPAEGEQVRAGRAYRSGATVVRAKVDHERTRAAPETRQDLFLIPTALRT